MSLSTSFQRISAPTFVGSHGEVGTMSLRRGRITPPGEMSKSTTPHPLADADWCGLKFQRPTGQDGISAPMTRDRADRSDALHPPQGRPTVRRSPEAPGQRPESESALRIADGGARCVTAHPASRTHTYPCPCRRQPPCPCQARRRLREDFHSHPPRAVLHT